MPNKNTPNRLKQETSPYLLMHADNPVDWYPWGEEAFAKAKAENKPIFLSIGYSTCHWCHVMAHESFEDDEIAALLNKHFVSVKVDREERPDIDSIYMTFCQAFTGSGGWPMSIFMTAEQKPFFAGTYFPKDSRAGMVGFAELLTAIHARWQSDRQELFETSEQVVRLLSAPGQADGGEPSHALLEAALSIFEQSFDERYGGFGSAPKFPTPHNLLFLLRLYEAMQNKQALHMAEVTLQKMYQGGLFDHIGGGFSRYSVDRSFLVPHFEKMLYDNALLIMAYSEAYSVTQNPLYRAVAEKTAKYILTEMTSPEGGFYCAQDADSDGVEGKYYIFSPDEILEVLGERQGGAFNRRFGITSKGNFEGKSIPNLLELADGDLLPTEWEALVRYRKQRSALHLDDKILTSWNALMIAALAMLYQATGDTRYLCAAQKANRFVAERLTAQESLLVSFRDGRATGRGFLEDYAFYAFANLCLYEATWEQQYLERTKQLCEQAQEQFFDSERGGFALYGKQNEQLVLTPVETYDGAIPSGNAVMAYALVWLSQLTGEERWDTPAQRQLAFLSAAAEQYPAGHSFFLLALLRFLEPPEHVVVVLGEDRTTPQIRAQLPKGTQVLLLTESTPQYPLLNGKTTFYACKNHSCLPPCNEYPSL